MKNISPSKLRAQLLAWYRRTRRDLPWRRKVELYTTLVSEFMLQQTRMDQALPYYDRFLKAFPTMRALARARPQQVLKLWEGLGYYRRARYLQQTAKMLAGKRTVTVDDLRDCPGIGPYILAAVSSIVLGEPMPVVDGNVKRVMSRLLALKDPPDTAENRARIHAQLTDWISPRAPGNWNQAMMELGATLCTPNNPGCARCPLRGWCRAYALGSQTDFPRKRPVKTRPHRKMVAAFIQRSDGRLLVCQRPETGLLAGLWELPGGECAAAGSVKSNVRKRVKEVTALSIQPGPEVAVIEHAYSHFSIRLHVFSAKYAGGTVRVKGYQAFRWVSPGQAEKLPFGRASKLALAECFKTG